MKCDSNVDGCQPCQSKDMICKSTDRITGQAHERGETARLKRENAELRAQVQAYQQQLGLQSPAQHPVPGPYQAYMSSNGYSRYGTLSGNLSGILARDMSCELSLTSDVLAILPYLSRCPAWTEIQMLRVEEQITRAVHILGQFTRPMLTLLTVR